MEPIGWEPMIMEPGEMNKANEVLRELESIMSLLDKKGEFRSKSALLDELRTRDSWRDERFYKRMNFAEKMGLVVVGRGRRSHTVRPGVNWREKMKRLRDNPRQVLKEYRIIPNPKPAPEFESSQQVSLERSRDVWDAFREWLKPTIRPYTLLYDPPVLAPEVIECLERNYRDIWEAKEAVFAMRSELQEPWTVEQTTEFDQAYLKLEEQIRKRITERHFTRLKC